MANSGHPCPSCSIKKSLKKGVCFPPRQAHQQITTIKAQGSAIKRHPANFSGPGFIKMEAKHNIPSVMFF